MNLITKTQNPSGSIDPLLQAVAAQLQASGRDARLGLPPAEEMERLKAKWEDRDFQRNKEQAEASGRLMTQKKERAREVIRRSREEQR